MLLATLLCWLAFVAVIIYINPTEAGFIGFLLFYVSLFLSLVGFFALLGFFVRIWLLTQPVVFKQVIIAFRQAIWFASLIVFCLILQSQKLLTWWTVILFIALLTFIESLFLFGRKK